MNRLAIPLLVAKDIEQQKSWEGISTPYDLALFFARIISVDVSGILELQEIVYSDVEPSGSDSKKFWVKTNEPVGFGVPTGDGYQVMFRYPPNIPILWTMGESEIPDYMTKLTAGQLSDYKLEAPDTDKAIWVMYNI